jgi:hypothetical protein
MPPAPRPVPYSLFRRFRINCDQSIKKFLFHDVDQDEAQIELGIKGMIFDLDCWIRQLRPNTDEEIKEEIKTMLEWQKVLYPALALS